MFIKTWHSLKLYVVYWCVWVPLWVAVFSISHFPLTKRTEKLLPETFIFHVSLIWHSSGINLAEYRRQIPNYHHPNTQTFSSTRVTTRQDTDCHKVQWMWCMTNVHDQDYRLQRVYHSPKVFAILLIKDAHLECRYGRLYTGKDWTHTLVNVC